MPGMVAVSNVGFTAQRRKNNSENGHDAGAMESAFTNLAVISALMLSLALPLLVSFSPDRLEQSDFFNFMGMRDFRQHVLAVIAETVPEGSSHPYTLLLPGGKRLDALDYLKSVEYDCGIGEVGCTYDPHPDFVASVHLVQQLGPVAQLESFLKWYLRGRIWEWSRTREMYMWGVPACTLLTSATLTSVVATLAITFSGGTIKDEDGHLDLVLSRVLSFVFALCATSTIVGCVLLFIHLGQVLHVQFPDNYQVFYVKCLTSMISTVGVCSLGMIIAILRAARRRKPDSARADQDNNLADSK